MNPFFQLFRIGVSPKALCISQNDSLARYGLGVSSFASPVTYTVASTGASGYATAYAIGTVASFATGISRYRSRKRIAISFTGTKIGSDAFIGW